MPYGARLIGSIKIPEPIWLLITKAKIAQKPILFDTIILI
ncbi:fic family domain protein [Wolbachia pipientis wVitA]|nr:fic family domain protein [Wolbachia pipientis wVitA]